ncbi:AraC family transcriptional regulator [Streptomyces sp. NPDC093223]|uniref:AraC family transcriptional regulator n=1 Tax=Streptomyces sp. NPDC093223 TaxID=3366033 RepID=UPI003801E0F6
MERLSAYSPTLQVILFSEESFSHEACPVSEPHRHEFHEMFWTKAGVGRHRLDGERVVAGANTVMLTGKGQMHLFERAESLSGAVIRFSGELLHDESGSSSDPGRLFTGRGASVVEVPGDETERLDAVVRALESEARRVADTQSMDINRYLLMTVVSWAERWNLRDRPPGERPAELALSSRFNEVLERDFTRHHDVRHYARELGVTPSALWRAVSRTTGHPPRALITERVMLEAVRLLRFTAMPIGEVAARVGVRDSLYFSRAFKARYGEAPRAYRARRRDA